MERKIQIDIAKAIGIILVVIGHATIASLVGKYIYCFHMPFFFILSGMCFKKGKYSFGVFAKKRIDQLLIPAILLTVVNYAIDSMGASSNYNITNLPPALPGALWFLPVLFLAEMIFFPLASLKPQFIRGGVFLLLIICCLLVYCRIEINYFSISTVPAATYFYGIGYLVTSGRIETLAKKIDKWITPLIMLLFALPIVRIYFYPETMLMFACQFETVDFILAPLTSIGVMLFAIQMAKLPSVITDKFVWLGKNTLIIMAIHQPIMWVFMPMRCVLPYAVFKLLEQLLMWSVSCISVILGNKYAPLLAGKAKLFSK